jgi:hypothetical protein
MPGIDLNLVLPSLSETQATNIARIATALQTIEDDLSADVTTGEIDINADLSMEGNALTNVRGIQFSDGYDAAPAGTMYYSEGEFYVVTADGVVRLTLAGEIDSSSFGGITGMGGTNASVVFDLASSEFRFYEDVGNYADLRAEDVILTNLVGGSVRLGVHSAITTARTFDIKSLPSSGVSLLAYNAATSTVEDGATLSITNNHTLTGTTTMTTGVVSVLTVGSQFRHPLWTTAFTGCEGLSIATTGVAVADTADMSVLYSSGISGAIIATWRKRLNLRNGERISSVTLNFTNAVSTIATMRLKRVSYSGAVPTTTTIGTNATSSGGLQNMGISVSQTALSGFEFLYIELEFGTSNTGSTSVYYVHSGHYTADSLA